MWEMRWKLLSVCAALIVVSSAQMHTIDNLVIIQPENISSSHEEIIEKHDFEHGNSSYISNITHEIPLTDDERKAISGNSDENENDNGNNIAAPNVSDARPIISSGSNETSESHDTSETTNESSKSSGPSKSQELSENESSKPSEPSESQESTENESSKSSEPSKSQESQEKVPSSETGSPQIRSSESKEPESGEQTGNGETPSGEKPASEESVEPQPPTGASGEGVEGSGQNSAGDAIEEQVVQTTHGPVKGYQWPANADIVAFYDIPYGTFNEPFETPTTAQSWLGVHEATSHTKICPQVVNDEYIGVSSCLTLSIFAPKDAENVSVLFHVYDSYANSKSADPQNYGPDYLVPKGVILVLPNYRIGPMGFLCLQNDTALGNAGLKDLSLALEWVKDNIHLFGGNPSNIVVSGEGAAGAYAGYLGICSRSKYYVKKVITESGSALSHLALDRNPDSTAFRLAEKIRLDQPEVIYNNTFAEVTLETILKVAKGIRFKPCIEHDKEPFIDDTPWKILQKHEIDAVFMIGSASLAGTHKAIDATSEFVAQINEHFDILLPEDLVFKNDDKRMESASKLRYQYFGEDNITANDLEELSLWYTDSSYLSPSIRLARSLVSAGARVFVYEFAFVGSLNLELAALDRPVLNAIRGDLMGYLFHKYGTSVDDDSAEKKIIDLIVDLWVSFINTGNPTAANLEWNELKKTDDEEEEWLLINSESKEKKGFHVDRLRLWTDLYDEHFIENNSGVKYTPPYFLSIAAVIMCLAANYKLNYNSQ